ncbi:MAG: amidase, partial [Firmicutes bacterium]|nr:amidase [Bacillota bacterium]
MDKFYEMTAAELHEEIQQRRIGVEELTRAYLDRIEKYDQSCGLNSVAVLNDSVIKEARKLDERQADRDLPLFGLPVLVKDNIDVEGFHTTAGSLALTDNAAGADAPLIRNLRRNGALILGKTNMTEFANYVSDDMPNGYSSRGGQVVHAYDPAKDPGGSSTGSGVAMSMGFAAACVGTDTSFSVVGCAQKHGITGFKPVVGSISAQGIVPICHTLDTAGPMTKTVGDGIMMYSAMCNDGFEPVDAAEPNQLKIGINTFRQELLASDHIPVMDAYFKR